ncbi:Uma2 family endonuclease [Kovacikia minuta CCNUW1]|uniref:Uma2 family endonuclease n=1 Tax=Kovacikia minuta TaxID=2931930 RepID=UPI001CCE16E7|nr:Uma2 family endonuclease [Kovacikia minuta]UBF27570.1 Uma2 family endonuclease [Kovacikia minuta CCNUW1]
MTILTTLNLDTVQLTDDQFYQLCQSNRDLKFERTAEGTLIVMAPIGGEGGNQEAGLITDVGIWNRQAGEPGLVFSSSTGFKLPNGAERSPDVAWVQRDRWVALTPEQRRKFPPLAPDFVLELRSTTDALEPLQAKMREYIETGVRLGWLINPQDRQVEVYRPGQPPEVLALPVELSGETVLPDFVLRLA